MKPLDLAVIWINNKLQKSTAGHRSTATRLHIGLFQHSFHFQYYCRIEFALLNCISSSYVTWPQPSSMDHSVQYKNSCCNLKEISETSLFKAVKESSVQRHLVTLRGSMLKLHILYRVMDNLILWADITWKRQ